MTDPKHMTQPGASVQKTDAHRIRQHLSKRCREIASQHLSALLGETLENMDKVLQEKARAGEGESQNLFKEAMVMLRTGREHIKTSSNARFLEVYEKSWLPPDNDKTAVHEPSHHDELSLIDDNELEEQLAVDHLCSKISLTHKDSIVALNHRLNAIDKALPTDYEHGPLSPSSISQLFRDVTRSLALDARIRLIFFKLIDRHGLSHFVKMYQEVNEYLARKGILPDFKASQAIGKIKQIASQKRAPGDTQHPQDASDRQNKPDQANPDENMFSSLISLMETGSGLQNAPSQLMLPPGVIPARPLMTADVVSAFSELQRNSVSAQELQELQDISQIRAHLAGELVRIRGEIAAGNVNSQDAHTIDLVGMLFDFIYDEPNLSDRLKAVISRLQMPMFKVAILDKDFFSNKSHPARALLNALSHAGIAGGEFGDDDALFMKIQEIVNRILEEFSENMDLFSLLLEDFEGFLESESARQRQMEQERLHESQRKDLEARARRQVETEISEHISDLQLPPILTEFFMSPWKDYVAKTAVDAGMESERYRSITEMMPVLLWSIAPLESAADRKRLAQSIPTLLTALRQVFRETQWDDEKIKRLYQKLEQYHFANLQGDTEKCLPRKDSPGTGAAASYLSDDMSDIEKLLDEVSEFEKSSVGGESIGSEDIVLHSQDILNDPFNDDYDDDDEFMTMVRELQQGQWLEFRQDNGRVQRAKLEWKGDIVDEYYFVNWRYQIVAVRHMKELADELRHGKARHIENLPLVDKALSTIMDRLLNAKKNR